jgi:hypothetical protein
MDDSFYLFFELALHCWQLWGITIFLIIPLFLVVVAAWDFFIWLDEKGGGR